MSDLPISVRVGYQTYRIEPWSPHEATANARLAECDRMSFVIRVREDLAPQNMANSLLHEIIHSAMGLAEYEARELREEENIVAVLTNILCQVIQDNPDVWAWIQMRLAGDGPVGKVSKPRPGSKA